MKVIEDIVTGQAKYVNTKVNKLVREGWTVTKTTRFGDGSMAVKLNKTIETGI